jgi:hypothetical protein
MEFDPQTIRPVASPFTSYTITAHEKKKQRMQTNLLILSVVSVAINQNLNVH